MPTYVPPGPKQLQHRQAFGKFCFCRYLNTHSTLTKVKLGEKETAFCPPRIRHYPAEDFLFVIRGRREGGLFAEVGKS